MTIRFRHATHRVLAAAVALIAILQALGCSDLLPTAPHRGSDPAEADASRLHAVLVNGGGRREINYYSHLDHLRRLLRLLEETGVDPARIAVFSGDGADPAADLATREADLPADFWLLPHGKVGVLLRPGVVYVDSTIEGFPLRPATREALRGWFAEEGSGLVPGDSLLFYVTDHGEKQSTDPSENTITLWGETLGVGELGELLALLDPEVRVVMVMSQCYSGGFAHAILPEDATQLPAGNRCGYFSTTADRKSSGCYPEVSGKPSTGHSHRLFEALDRLHRLTEAQRRLLVSDRTPDVPSTSSGLFLEQRLRQAAGAREPSALADELLAEAWRNPVAWEREIRLLDEIGQSFGFASPRSFQELERQAAGLPELGERLGTYARLWRRALDDLRLENLGLFLEEHPEWRPRLEPQALAPLDTDARRQRTAELLAELVPFTGNAPQREARLRDLHWKAEEAKAAHYRAEVRLGVVLRMRALLARVAGRVYLAQGDRAEEARAFERLVSCEDLALGGRREAPFAPPSPPPEPFPPLADERERLEAITPAWLGIKYRPLVETEGRRPGLPRGAVSVIEVFPDSPASMAGIRVSDVLVGSPDLPFQEPHSVREWTMQSPVGAPLALRLARDGRRLQVTLRLAPYPLELPKLPGPPPIGSVAPPLELEFFRGAEKLGSEAARLLFFWATWCHHCRSAIPELLAFGREKNVPVVAITDEAPERLKKFFREHPGAFPSVIAADPRRIAFQSYGVSGTPTFVLLDDEGVVRHYQTGYSRKRGLQIPGWQWQQRPTRQTGTLLND
jgi:thiol-disulfide isomerase/thioredoxin